MGLQHHPGWRYLGFAEVGFDNTAVPEPATLGLFGFCLAGLALVRRQRG